MIRRDRSKQVIVENVLVKTVTISSVLQVGDVYGPASPFTYQEAYGGFRGAPSFVTAETVERVDTRLHYANQLDEDVLDLGIRGEDVYTFIPNTYGGQAR